MALQESVAHHIKKTLLPGNGQDQQIQRFYKVLGLKYKPYPANSCLFFIVRRLSFIGALFCQESHICPDQNWNLFPRGYTRLKQDRAQKAQSYQKKQLPLRSPQASF